MLLLISLCWGVYLDPLGACFILVWVERGCFCSETRSHCLAQAGLELMILLPQSPEGWDYRSDPQQPASIVYFELICMCGTR